MKLSLAAAIHEMDIYKRDNKMANEDKERTIKAD